jgi:hypothetical protein
MKRAIITTSRAQKLAAINALNALHRKCLVILPRAEQSVLQDLAVPHEHLFLEQMNKAVLFLDFQTKVNPDVMVVVYNALRYSTPNNTKYNRIYQLTATAQNVMVCDSFPFVFDRRNLWVLQKILGVARYHHKQFYDDGFFIEREGRRLAANSLEAVYPDLRPYLETDFAPLRYELHAWQHTAEEQSLYESKKRRAIYEKNYPKVRVVTSLQGFANRFESKFAALCQALAGMGGRPLIFYNWEEGIRQHRPRVPLTADLVSYHQETPNCASAVVFYETIINQKIHFYDKLAQYAAAPLHLFLNPKLGADRLAANATIQILEELNAFAAFDWKGIANP